MRSGALIRAEIMKDVRTLHEPERGPVLASRGWRVLHGLGLSGTSVVLLVVCADIRALSLKSILVTNA